MAVQHKRSLLALVSLGAGLVLFALNFAFPLQAVIPLGLAALGMMYHPSVSVCAALLAMALSAIVRGPEAAVLLFMFASGGLIMPFLVRKKVSSLYTVFIAASVTIITLWCGMVFFADVINAAFARGKTAIIEQFAFLERSGLGAAFFSADQLNAMRSMNVLMLEILGDALAGMMFGYSMILALLMYLLCRKIAQKRGTPLAPFAKFAQWRLPAGFGFGAFILFFASFLVEINYGQEQASLALILRTVIIVPFTVQGMCVLEFYLSKKKVHAAARVAANVALTLFLSLVLTYCGMFEHAFALRRRADLQIK